MYVTMVIMLGRRCYSFIIIYLSVTAPPVGHTFKGVQTLEVRRSTVGAARASVSLQHVVLRTRAVCRRLYAAGRVRGRQQAQAGAVQRLARRFQLYGEEHYHEYINLPI